MLKRHFLIFAARRQLRYIPSKAGRHGNPFVHPSVEIIGQNVALIYPNIAPKDCNLLMGLPEVDQENRVLQ